MAAVPNDQTPQVTDEMMRNVPLEHPRWTCGQGFEVTDQFKKDEKELEKKLKRTTASARMDSQPVNLTWVGWRHFTLAID